MSEREKRIQNTLWGLFVADALAMPAHWYYSLSNVDRDFPGGILGYEAPPHPHPESFMVGAAYKPDVAKARELGRAYDMLHEHVRFYDTSYSEQSIVSSEQESEHGNAVPRLEERYHYHHGLKAGDNTLGAHLVLLLMQTVSDNGKYDPRTFLKEFIEYMTTPGRNQDPYTEIYLRRWFENYATGYPPHACAPLQRDAWSIGSHGGMIRPLVLSLLAKDAYQGLGLAIEHQNLTHRSENTSSALHVLIPLLFDLLDGRKLQEALAAHAARIRLPKVTGRELHQRYKKANGPGNIPDHEMWRLHTEFEDTSLDLPQLAALPESEVVLARLATACYPEHGLPLLFYLAYRNPRDIGAVLLANANAGGDNVHRGMLLGMLMGASVTKIPAALPKGLRKYESLKYAIEAFSALALSGKGI